MQALINAYEFTCRYPLSKRSRYRKWMLNLKPELSGSRGFGSHALKNHFESWFSQNLDCEINYFVCAKVKFNGDQFCKMTPILEAGAGGEPQNPGSRTTLLETISRYGRISRNFKSISNFNCVATAMSDRRQLFSVIWVSALTNATKNIEIRIVFHSIIFQSKTQFCNFWEKGVYVYYTLFYWPMNMNLVP